MIWAAHPAGAIIAAFILNRTYWMSGNRRTALYAYVLITTGYSVIAAPIAVVISDQINTIQMAITLTLSSLCALPGYHIGGWLNNWFGSKRVCCTMLPLYLLNLGIFLVFPSWLPVAWIVFGLVNGIIYTAIEALFRQSVNNDSYGEGLAYRRMLRQNRSQKPEVLRKEFTQSRFRKAFSTSALISYIAAGVGTAVGIWLAVVTYIGWVVLALTIVGIAYVLIWQVDEHRPSACRQKSQKLSLRIKLRLLISRTGQQSKVKAKRKQSLRARMGLYAIALPYLGIAIANTVFMTYLPLDIGVQAGIILMVSRIAYGMANLPAENLIKCKGESTIFRWSICALVCGILLIPSAQLLNVDWLVWPFYLLTAILTGFAVSCSKLVIKLRLQDHAPEAKKGSATAPLFQTSELGFLIGPITFGVLAEYGGSYTIMWLTAAAVPLLSFALMGRERKRE